MLNSTIFHYIFYAWFCHVIILLHEKIMHENFLFRNEIATFRKRIFGGRERRGLEDGV